MRNGLTIVLFTLILINYTHAQGKYQFGLELTTNFAVKGVQPSLCPTGINAFAIYKRHELYIGADISKPLDRFRRVIGFESGYKYHFYREDRKSNFFLDLNFQYNRYCWGGGGWSLNYNFKPEGSYFDDPHWIVKGGSLSAMVGYENYFTNWFSLALSAGPGINIARAVPGEKYPYKTTQDYNRAICLIKLSARFFLK